MSHACPPEHERWLVEALASGPETLDPTQRRALEDCAHCSAEWAELLEVRTTVARAAEAERQNVASAVHTAGAAEEHFVRTVLAPRLAPAAPRRRRIVPWLIVGAAVAAGLLLLLAHFREAEAPRHTPETVLGRNLTLVVPDSGQVPDRLEWTDTEPDGLRYRVTIWPTNGDESKPLLERVVSDRFLILASEAITAWPPRVSVRVQALDRERETVPGVEDLAELSR